MNCAQRFGVSMTCLSGAIVEVIVMLSDMTLSTRSCLPRRANEERGGVGGTPDTVLDNRRHRLRNLMLHRCVCYASIGRRHRRHRHNKSSVFLVQTMN